MYHFFPILYLHRLLPLSSDMHRLYAQTSPSRLDLHQITVNEAATASSVPDTPVTPTSEGTEFSDSESFDLSRTGVQVHETPSVMNAVSFTSLYIYTFSVS